MFFIRKTILNGNNYQLDRCFPEIHDASYRDKFADSETPNGFTRLSSGVFCRLINIRPRYLVFRQGNSCTLGLICLVRLPDSLGMISCTLAIQIHAFTSVGTYLKEPELGITV